MFSYLRTGIVSRFRARFGVKEEFSLPAVVFLHSNGSDFLMLCVFHFQCYSLSFQVNVYHFYNYLRLKGYHFVGVAYEVVGHLRDVYQPILMHTNVYKGAEIGDVGYYSRQLHACNKVFGGMHTGVEAEGFCLSSRVATGFFQFGHDVVQRGQARCGRYIPADVDAAALVVTVDKLRYGAPTIGCHALYDGVTFGMYGRGV